MSSFVIFFHSCFGSLLKHAHLRWLKTLEQLLNGPCGEMIPKWVCRLQFLNRFRAPEFSFVRSVSLVWTSTNLNAKDLCVAPLPLTDVHLLFQWCCFLFSPGTRCFMAHQINVTWICAHKVDSVVAVNFRPELQSKIKAD